MIAQTSAVVPPPSAAEAGTTDPNSTSTNSRAFVFQSMLSSLPSVYQNRFASSSPFGLRSLAATEIVNDLSYDIPEQRPPDWRR